MPRIRPVQTNLNETYYVPPMGSRNREYRRCRRADSPGAKGVDLVDRQGSCRAMGDFDVSVAIFGDHLVGCRA